MYQQQTKGIVDIPDRLPSQLWLMMVILASLAPNITPLDLVDYFETESKG